MICCAHYAEASRDCPDGKIYVLNQIEFSSGGYRASSSLPPVRYCPWCGEKVALKVGSTVRPKSWRSASGRLMCVIGDEAYVAWRERALDLRWPLADLERVAE